MVPRQPVHCRLLLPHASYLNNLVLHHPCWLFSELLRPKSRRRLANAITNFPTALSGGELLRPHLCSMYLLSLLPMASQQLCTRGQGTAALCFTCRLHISLSVPCGVGATFGSGLFGNHITTLSSRAGGKARQFFYRSPSDPVFALHSIFWELWAEWGLPTQAMLGALRILISLLCFCGAGTQGLPWYM